MTKSRHDHSSSKSPGQRGAQHVDNPTARHTKGNRAPAGAAAAAAPAPRMDAIACEPGVARGGQPVHGLRVMVQHPLQLPATPYTSGKLRIDVYSPNSTPHHNAVKSALQAVRRLAAGDTAAAPGAATSNTTAASNDAALVNVLELLRKPAAWAYRPGIACVPMPLNSITSPVVAEVPVHSNDVVVLRVLDDGDSLLGSVPLLPGWHDAGAADLPDIAGNASHGCVWQLGGSLVDARRGGSMGVQLAKLTGSAVPAVPPVPAAIASPQATIQVLPHFHTKWCDRKRAVCTCGGAVREQNRLGVIVCMPAAASKPAAQPRALWYVGMSAAEVQANGLPAHGAGHGTGVVPAPEDAAAEAAAAAEVATASPAPAAPTASPSKAPPSAPPTSVPISLQVARAQPEFFWHDSTAAWYQRVEMERTAPDAWKSCSAAAAAKRAQASLGIPDIPSLFQAERGQQRLAEFHGKLVQARCTYAGPAAGGAGARGRAGHGIAPVPWPPAALAANAGEGSLLGAVAPRYGCPPIDEVLHDSSAALALAAAEASETAADRCLLQLAAEHVGRTVLCLAVLHDGTVLESPVVGPVEALPPAVRECWLEGDTVVGHTLTARSWYCGGTQGLCEWTWIRVTREGMRETSDAEPAEPLPNDAPANPQLVQCRQLTAEDIGCVFKAQVLPVRADGASGGHTTSRPCAEVQPSLGDSASA